MLVDVTDAKYIEGYILEVAFEDGKRGIIDFSDYLFRGGVFAKFNNLDFFKSFTVSNDLGTIVWGDEIDIAPETLYEKCQQSAAAYG
ncbi:MAG: DUF2442 domain-containing protein [Bacteroidia bacterium]|nr:DUF2442 domain-containing protein [Bacteroidia bacterium]